MSDLISRQAAIDALAKFVPYAICDESTESYTNGLTDAYNLICQLPSAQQEQRWIPCSERLPEDYQDVLVWFEYYRYGSYNRMYSTHGIGTYSKRYDSWMINYESGWKDLHVIAWMPLPEPYKTESEDKE